MSKKCQSAVEVMIILAVSIFILSMILVVGSKMLGGSSSKVESSKARTTVDSLSNAADLVYQEGVGSRTRVYVTLPDEIQSFTTQNQTLKMRLYSGGDLKDVYRNLDFNISGELPSEEGNYWIYLESREGYVYISKNASIKDLAPPNSVTNLADKSSGYTWIYWNWTNPSDTDFSQSIVFIGGINVLNTSNNYYNATGLSEDTSYTINIHTKDINGNINDNNVTDDASTLHLPIVIVSLSENPDPVAQNSNVTITANVTSDNEISSVWAELGGVNYSMVRQLQTELVTKWTEDFSSDTDWATWDSEGWGIAYVNSASDCIDDSNDDCMNADGFGTNDLYKQTDIDLSDCVNGSAYFYIEKVKEEGTLESSDCMEAHFSEDSGNSWSSDYNILCDDDPDPTKNITIPDQYLTSQARVMIEKENFGGFGEDVWLDGFRIDCSVQNFTGLWELSHNTSDETGLVSYTVYANDTSGNNAVPKTGNFTVELIWSLLFSDNFDRSDSSILGNGWIEVDSDSDADSKISSNRLVLDTDDNTNQPRALHSFDQKSTGTVNWTYTLNFERTGSENWYELFMQLGNNATMVDPSTSDSTGVAVNLKWAGPNQGMTNHEGFGYVQGGSVTEVEIVSGGDAVIEIIADMDSNVFNVSVDGVQKANDVSFDNNVSVDAVRIYTDGLYQNNFDLREIDSITVHHKP